MAADGGPAVTEFAPAKINLTLHVTGRRADGYHLLDSLVVFARVGDRITARAAPDLSLRVVGPQAGAVPAGGDNLVLRAARLLGRPARLTLTKRLPVASGIGGGSADAAATLRALARLYGLPLPEDVQLLGADVPVCLWGRPARMSGTGEALAPAPALPAAWLVLANPMQAVSTAAVFGAMAQRDHAPMPAVLPGFADVDGLAQFLAAQRNDMEAAALGLAPRIGLVKAALAAQAGCRIARMSGSGGTCFGLFERADAAQAAVRRLRRAEPGWWVRAGAICGQEGPGQMAALRISSR